ncbi:MAG: hypothetical protein CSYNP_02647 [Syntrophus sp. SKADARSKE-3]|nr:hypothetical protein [Syntrophus sp. SKADARSKE-3]
MASVLQNTMGANVRFDLNRPGTKEIFLVKRGL